MSPLDGFRQVGDGIGRTAVFRYGMPRVAARQGECATTGSRLRGSALSLFVALVGDAGSASPPREVSWGAWSVCPVTEPTALATEPLVTSGRVTRVLVLAPEPYAARAHVLASAIGATRPTVSVRVESVPASTWALTRVMELAGRLAGSANGTYAAIMATLGASTWGAWLPSVAQLAAPAPNLRQHVQSWLPGGAGFLAVGGPDGWVERLPLAVASGRSLRTPPPPREPDLPEHTTRRPDRLPKPGLECHSAGELPEPAIAALFALGVERRPQRSEPGGGRKELWGTDRAVEFLVCPSTLVDIGLPSATCPHCAQQVWHGEFCPFCRVAPWPQNLPANQAMGVSS